MKTTEETRSNVVIVEVFLSLWPIVDCHSLEIIVIVIYALETIFRSHKKVYQAVHGWGGGGGIVASHSI